MRLELWLFTATFHYSSQLQTWWKTWFSAILCGFATRLRPAFDFFVKNLVANLLHQSRHVQIDQQVRHKMYRRSFWNTACINSGRRVLYAPYLCLSLICCLTHVECFRFFLATNIVVAPKLQTMNAVQTTNDSGVCVLHIAKDRSGFVVMSHTLLEKSPRLKQVHNWLATCLRHAYASLRPGFWPGLQLARIMECSCYILSRLVR